MRHNDNFLAVFKVKLAILVEDDTKSLFQLIIHEGFEEGNTPFPTCSTLRLIRTL